MTANETQAERCERCGRDIVGFYKHTMVGADDGRLFCSEECAEASGYACCEECGEHPPRSLMLDIDGHLFCDGGCAEAHGYRKCERCGDWQHEDHAIETQDASFFCDASCARLSGYCQCESCEEWLPVSEMLEATDGTMFCDSDCADSGGYVICPECDDLVREDDALYVDGSWYCCDECANSAGHLRCDDCDGWVSSDDAYSTHDDRTICHSCRDRDYLFCEECEELFHEDDVSYVGGEILCRHCEDERCGAIHEYGYMPDLTFFGESATHPYLGIELEIDDGNRSECAKEIDGKYSDRIYMTRDSSLSDDGIELTSHPMTTETHLGGWWEDVADIAKGHGFTSHDNGRCGLHIHINRSFFGGLTAQLLAGQKLVTLMTRFKRPLMAFSRRESDRWCQFSNMSYMSRLGEHANIREKAMFVQQRESGHSMAVNFEHDATFELRIFRGTLKVSSLYASIAMADAMARAAKAHGTAWCETVSWYEFAEWAVSTCDIEAGKNALAAYLHEKGLIEEHRCPVIAA